METDLTAALYGFQISGGVVAAGGAFFLIVGMLALVAHRGGKLASTMSIVGGTFGIVGLAFYAHVLIGIATLVVCILLAVILNRKYLWRR